MKVSKFSTWTFVIFLLLSMFMVIHLLFGFLTPVVMSLVIVSIFNPLHKLILRMTRSRPYLSATISTLIVFLMVMIPSTLFLFALIDQALSFYQTTQQLTSSGNFSDWIASLKNYLDLLRDYLLSYGINITPEPIIKMATTFSQALGKKLYDSIGLVATNLISLTFNFVLTVALVFVFFVSGRATKTFLMDLVPIPDNEKERLVKRFRELVSAVFMGNGLISLLEGILGGILFYLFNIPGALIWAAVMTIAAFMPFVGATVVIIPATIYLFLVTETWKAILFVSLNTVYLSILETMLKPRLIGNKSQMHAALVFLSIIAGVQIYGMLGLFYGPLLVTMFLSLAQIYKEHYRDRLLSD